MTRYIKQDYILNSLIRYFARQGYVAFNISKTNKESTQFLSLFHLAVYVPELNKLLLCIVRSSRYKLKPFQKYEIEFFMKQVKNLKVPDYMIPILIIVKCNDKISKIGFSTFDLAIDNKYFDNFQEFVKHLIERSSI